MCERKPASFPAMFLLSSNSLGSLRNSIMSAELSSARHAARINATVTEIEEASPPNAGPRMNPRLNAIPMRLIVAPLVFSSLKSDKSDIEAGNIAAAENPSTALARKTMKSESAKAKIMYATTKPAAPAAKTFFLPIESEIFPKMGLKTRLIKAKVPVRSPSSNGFAPKLSA